MKIVIIAALAQNGTIGDAGKIPWHISDDLKRFKRLTLGHPIIMGRIAMPSLIAQAAAPAIGAVLLEFGGVDTALAAIVALAAFNVLLVISLFALMNVRGRART